MPFRAALCLVAIVAFTTTANAEPSFEWRAPETCPTFEQLRARVERRLGSELHGLAGIDIEVSQSRGHYVARVDLRAFTVANDVRSLTSTSCDDLADAVAVILAGLASEPARGRVPPVEAVIESVGEIEIPTEPPSLPLRRYGMRVEASSAIGAQPGFSVGREVAVSVEHGRLFGELAERVDDGLAVVIGRFGWAPRPWPVRLWMGAERGEIAGQVMDQHERWLAIGSGGSVAWRLVPGVALVGKIEIAVPLSYRHSPATVRTAVGLEMGM